jgi:hypothetical protein
MAIAAFLSEPRIAARKLQVAVCELCRDYLGDEYGPFIVSETHLNASSRDRSCQESVHTLLLQETRLDF